MISHYLIQMEYTAIITDKEWENMQNFEPKNKETMKGKGQEMKDREWPAKWFVDSK